MVERTWEKNPKAHHEKLGKKKPPPVRSFALDLVHQGLGLPVPSILCSPLTHIRKRDLR